MCPDCLLLLSRFVVIIILLSGRERADGQPARVGGADEPHNGNRLLRRRGPLRRFFFFIFTSVFPPPPRPSTIPGVGRENIHTKRVGATVSNDRRKSYGFHRGGGGTASAHIARRERPCFF